MEAKYNKEFSLYSKYGNIGEYYSCPVDLYIYYKFIIIFECL